MDELTKFIKNKNHNEAIKCLDHLKKYISDLAQKNIDLQSIVTDPEGEIARCHAEVRELQLKLRLQDAYSISSEERLEGHKWLTQHNDDLHNGLDDHHWEISPFALGIAVAIVCDQCGEKYCVRTD